MVSTRASMYAILAKEKVCVLCARACVCTLNFIFKSLRPHGLECALNLGVRSLMPLRRHGSTCFGESSNRFAKPSHGDGRRQHRGAGSGKMREGGNMIDRRDQNPVYCARAGCHESRPHLCTFQLCHRCCKSTGVYTACTAHSHLI